MIAVRDEVMPAATGRCPLLLSFLCSTDPLSVCLDWA